MKTGLVHEIKEAAICFVIERGRRKSQQISRVRLRAQIKLVYTVWNLPDSNLDPELFCACRGERSRALGNPGTRLSLIGFSKNEWKCFWLVHISLHKSGWTCGVSGAWAGFSLECSSEHDRPILDFSDSKTTFARLIRQNYWIFQFSNKIA